MVGKGGRVRKKRGMWVEFQKANKDPRNSRGNKGKTRVLPQSHTLIRPNILPRWIFIRHRNQSAMTPSKQGGLEYENAVLSRRKNFSCRVLLSFINVHSSPFDILARPKVTPSKCSMSTTILEVALQIQKSTLNGYFLRKKGKGLSLHQVRACNRISPATFLQ